jgi:pantoate--beta-alanine ligase
MKTCASISELQLALRDIHQAHKSIAFVPTMGNLHEGHLSLVRKAKEEAAVVVVSIFVNPLQFGANEDLDKYPRTLEEDKRLLTQENTDFLFTPTVSDIYPLGMQNQTTVCVPNITQYHCGHSRPGHFDGVSTVVMKLFNIVQPDIAIFGQKDFQQLAVIRKMVADLCVPIRIIGAPTGRAADGLALSSRNQYLSPEQRAIAPEIYQTLLRCQSRVLENPRNIDEITATAKKELENKGLTIDYLNICDASTLSEIHANTQEIVILAAVFAGKTRLIDNISFTPLNRRNI